MSIQDLGSIGELVAAIATIATLAYLAVQVRQNTLALRSSTFQAISEQMAQNVQPFLNDPEIGEIMAKGLTGAELGTGERLRFQSALVMSFRRMESVYMQTRLGSIDAELASGFELSMLTILQSPGALAWWETAKVAFNRSFTEHVDTWLAEHESASVHPSMGLPLD